MNLQKQKRWLKRNVLWFVLLAIILFSFEAGIIVGTSAADKPEPVIVAVTEEPAFYQIVTENEPTPSEEPEWQTFTESEPTPSEESEWKPQQPVLLSEKCWGNGNVRMDLFIPQAVIAEEELPRQIGTSFPPGLLTK